jgi:hypothetical protein
VTSAQQGRFENQKALQDYDIRVGGHESVRQAMADGPTSTDRHIRSCGLLVVNAGNDQELDTTFAAMDRERVGALLFASDPFFLTRRDQLVSLAAKQQIPAIYYLREFADVGGLMS